MRMRPQLTLTNEMERLKFGEPKHPGSSVKHSGDDVMASGTGSLVFIVDIMHDGNTTMNSRVHSHFKEMQPELQELLSGRKWKVLH